MIFADVFFQFLRRLIEFIVVEMMSVSRKKALQRIASTELRTVGFLQNLAQGYQSDDNQLVCSFQALEILNLITAKSIAAMEE